MVHQRFNVGAIVSTHSRPKAAARLLPPPYAAYDPVSTHSRPKAAAHRATAVRILHNVSTHSRPKAAAQIEDCIAQAYDVSTHSRPKAAACAASGGLKRRRGFNTQPPEGGWLANRFPHAVQHVSTHSRLKAAGGKFRDNVEQDGVSTHSRLKAAGHTRRRNADSVGFQHTAA